MINLHPDLPLMSQKQVHALFGEVARDMAGHVFPSLTELYYPNSKDKHIFENGTGAFVEIDGTKLLLSNDHVICNPGLAHSFYGAEVFVRAAAQRYGNGAPIDVGVAKVNKHAWTKYGAKAEFIALDRFASKHATFPNEILWIAGYPGARVRQFDNLQLAVCETTPTQEYLFNGGAKPHELFDPTNHFAVYYSPANAMKIDEGGSSSSPVRSSPPGLSGSLVWNTHRLECFYANRPWTPELALVTGIVWGWPNSDYLIATKVERFREFLITAAKLPDSPTESI